MMRIYLDGKEVDPSEYSLQPIAGTPGAMVVNFRGTISPGLVTFEYDDGWKYGDLLDFKPDGTVVMYVGYVRGTLHRVIALAGDTGEFDALDDELATIRPPSMLART